MNKKEYQNEFVSYTKDLLEQFGNIIVRPMFGSFGIYKDGLMFALIADNELYLKADENAIILFETYGSTPFTYENKGKLVRMSYMKVPPEVLEEQETIKKWMEMAYTAAMSTKKKTKEQP